MRRCVIIIEHAPCIKRLIGGERAEAALVWGGEQVCAAREVVLQQTWRMDSDGTYIVLVQSVDHPSAPANALNYVRARVRASSCNSFIANPNPVIAIPPLFHAIQTHKNTLPSGKPSGARSSGFEMLFFTYSMLC
jgi:hypothetical protein